MTLHSLDVGIVSSDAALVDFYATVFELEIPDDLVRYAEGRTISSSSSTK